MMVSLDPPTLAIGLASESSFHELLPEGAFLGVSILKSAQEFTSERFAGRGPVPNRAFAGIPYDIMPPGAEPGVPILRGSLGWCRCVVRSRSEVGDHVLVLAAIVDGELGIDSEDPLLSYEAQYRGLELL